MSGALAGSLHTSSFADVLAWLVREQRTGVLRIRYASSEGAGRGEVVLANGRLIGGALYRSGGVKGTGDALVDAALCSPEDAQGALEYAAQTAQYAPGTLAEGAARAGVSIQRVEETLIAHLERVLQTMMGWRAGSWEFLLEGLPVEAEDRDSAAARAFLLDSGVEPSSLKALGDLSSTLVEKAAEVARESNPDVTRKSKAVTGPPPPATSLKVATSLSSEEPTPPEGTPVMPPQMDTQPDFPMPAGAPTTESEPFVPDAVTAVAEAPAMPQPEPEPESPAAEEPPTPAEHADEAIAAADPSDVAAEVAPPDWDPGATAPSPEFGAPGSLDDEPLPGTGLEGPAPTFERPAGDLDAEPEPEAPEPGPRIDVAGPASSALGEDLFEDADDSVPEAAPPEQMAAPDDGGDEPPDEPTQADPPGEIDWTAPGGAEAALMEAETLLDSEVLSVMLEMGSSAAQTASATVPGTERILTGHVLIVDEEGQMTGVVLAVPLREAGYVVHLVRGLSAGADALNRASADGQHPLAIIDLLLKRGDSGMLGGLDLVAQATSLGIPSILMGEAGDDARAKAEAAGVSAVLPRPLRSDFKKEDVRKAFVESVLAAIDAHRPQPEWVSAEAPAEQLDTGGPAEEEGWDVQGLEKKAEEVDDLPDFAMTDPAARMDSLWRETAATLSGPLSRPEILLQVLRFGAEVLTRAVLFIPQGRKGAAGPEGPRNGARAEDVELGGFGQFGIELAPGVDADDSVRKIRLPLEGHPGIARAISTRQAVKTKPGTAEWEAHLTMALGGITPDEVYLGPVFCQGRLAALLYGDMLPAHASLPDTTNLEVVLGQAGMALDRAELEARLAALERKD